MSTQEKKMSTHLSVPETTLQLLLKASNSSSLEEALQNLIETSKTSDGRADLASMNMISAVLELCQAVNYSIHNQLLLLCLKLLRNLCAGEVRNQNLFIEQNGIGIVSSVISSSVCLPDIPIEILRMVLQLLGNVALAGTKHQHVLWREFFPHKFSKIAELRTWMVCDPLCMVIHTCTSDADGLLAELCSDKGLPLIIEILCTVSKAGFREEWVKSLLSRVCFDGLMFESLFSKLFPKESKEDVDNNLRVDEFVTEQAFLLSILSEMLNQVNDIAVSNEFALSVLKVLKTATAFVDFARVGMSGLPTGDAVIDIVGYSLNILRDICASGDSADVVDVLVSAGLIEFLLSLLNDLEPPSILKSTMKQDESSSDTSLSLSKKCPYKGFRRDIVAILGNCSYRRKQVQDEIREKGGILLLLQQCVTDEDNPFLREWGFWCVRNLLEGNAANQQLVGDLKIQGTVDVPELARLGLQVAIDPNTQRPKLVNV